jgi:hypothetical protein
VPGRHPEQQEHAGTASTPHNRKKLNQPKASTSQPAEALMKVRGTAIRLVNKASWVAV